MSPYVAASVVPRGRVVSYLGGGTIRRWSRVVRGGSGIRLGGAVSSVGGAHAVLGGAPGTWEALTQRWEEDLSNRELDPAEAGAAVSDSWEAGMWEEIGRM